MDLYQREKISTRGQQLSTICLHQPIVIKDVLFSK
jgi:hypothetical protein